ncbi:MAG TPA: ATP-binding cassette domain-containing protein [Kofleriaceae bacterium]|nr:ATP-binding cassette domain-containing protein [Kofleriaceae bacterium]
MESAGLDQAPSGARAPAIETDALTRRFGGLVAVDHLTLAIERGTIFGLLGSNGAGKTTLIKMLTTILPPTSGQARVAGCDVVRDARRVRARIGYVPQLVSADGALTGRENLTLSARLYGVPRRARADAIAQALAFMDLDEAADRLVRGYSGGMIRRLEIAQALLHRPEVLFLDEPTIGLDPLARQAVWERLRELRERGETTILLTTHDMEEAELLCDRIAILHRGTVRADGTLAELCARFEAERLEEIFVRVAGGPLDTGGSYRDVARARRTARRLG